MASYEQFLAHNAAEEERRRQEAQIAADQQQRQADLARRAEQERAAQSQQYLAQQYGAQSNLAAQQIEAQRQRDAAAIDAQRQRDFAQAQYQQAHTEQQFAGQGQLAEQGAYHQNVRDTNQAAHQAARDTLLNGFQQQRDWREHGYNTERDYLNAVYRAMHDEAHDYRNEGITARRDERQFGYQTQLSDQHFGQQGALANQHTWNQGLLNAQQNAFQGQRDERHVDLQGRLNQIQLTQTENMRMQRMRDAIAGVDANPNLTNDERQNLITQLRSGLDPLENRMRESQMLTQQLQRQGLEQHLQQQASYAQTDLDFRAANYRNGIATINPGTPNEQQFYQAAPGHWAPVPQSHAAQQKAVADERRANNEANRALSRERLFQHLYEHHDTGMAREETALRAAFTPRAEWPAHLQSSTTRSAELNRLVAEGMRVADQNLHRGQQNPEGAGDIGMPQPAPVPIPAPAPVGSRDAFNQEVAGANPDAERRRQEAATQAIRRAADLALANSPSGHTHEDIAPIAATINNFVANTGWLGRQARDLGVGVHDNIVRVQGIFNRANQERRGLTREEAAWVEHHMGFIRNSFPNFAANIELPAPRPAAQGPPPTTPEAQARWDAMTPEEQAAFIRRLSIPAGELVPPPHGR